MVDLKFIIPLLLFCLLCSCQEKGNSSLDVPIIKDNKYNTSATLLNININQVPEEAKGTSIFLYYFSTDRHYCTDTIALNANNPSVNLKVNANNKGFYDLNGRGNSGFIVGIEDTILINCDYQSLLTTGNLEIISEENKGYTESLKILREEFKQRQIIEKEIKSLTYAQSNYISLQQEVNTTIEKHFQDYNYRFDSLADLLPNSYLSEMVIPFLKMPVRSADDPFDNYRSYLYKNYLHNVPIDNTDLLHCPLFSQFIYNYLNYYKGSAFPEYIDGATHLLSSDRYHPEVQTFVKDVFIDYYVQTERPGVAKEIALLGEDGCSDDLLADIEAGADFYKGLEIGEMIPNIELEDFDLYQMIKNNPNTFLYFWKSGCEACEKEHLAIRKHYQQLIANNVGIVGFAFVYDSAEFEESIAIKKMQWKNVSDFEGNESAYIQSFRIKSTPATFYIDNNGQLLYKQISIEDVIKQMDQ